MLGALVSAPVMTATAAGATGLCGPPVVSVIACENTQPGDPPSDWQVSGAGDAALQGFATQMSVKAGDVVSFKVDATASAYHVDILRFGYYQGTVRAQVATLTGPFPMRTQPACTTDSTTGLVDCGNWSVGFTWTVPAGSVSGVYAAHLVRNDNGDGSLVPFVVRDDTSHSDIVVQTSDDDVAGVQHLRRQQPLLVHGCVPARQPRGVQGRVQGLVQPAVPHGRRTTPVAAGSPTPSSR